MGVKKHQHNLFLDGPLDDGLRYNNNNNHVCNKDHNMNNISQFYKGSNIFITGATGFVGKAVVEKLLRTCTDLDSIYLLMRPKRGMGVEQRLKELFKSTVFNRIREKDPGVFEKVKIIPGDVGAPNMGISENDRLILEEKINVVFHSAATVKFNEDLKNAVILNTVGTKSVVDLCKKMKNLKSFVHISTAFSNADKEIIEENVYKPPYDPNAIISCMEVLNDEAIEELSKKILGRHPNTYTFTKAMAEHIVSENSSIIPSCVVRPAIITPAWKEPYPGWVDNVSGITGVLMECGRGTIKSILCNDQCTMELIPVDIVVNTILTAAWHTAAYSSNTMRVYNCTSGPSNPIKWDRFGQLAQKYSVIYPSKYVSWYPSWTYRTNRLMHYICATLFVTIPAAFLDFFLFCTGQKPIMLKITNKFYKALAAGAFFALNQWTFNDGHMQGLTEAIKEAEDGANFEVDVRPPSGFDWDPYVKDCILGVRQYILKDDLSTLPQARTKLNRLYWFRTIFQLVSMYAILKWALNLF